MARTPQEIFAHPAEVLVAGDIEGIVFDGEHIRVQTVRCTLEKAG